MVCNVNPASYAGTSVAKFILTSLSAWGDLSTVVILSQVEFIYIDWQPTEEAIMSDLSLLLHHPHIRTV